MAKRPKKRAATNRKREQVPASKPKDFYSKSIIGVRLSDIWLPLLLAAVTFLVYWPSLKSGLVYDAQLEIEEGFFTSLSNLPAVLSLKVLGMNLILGPRPGSLLYLMLIAAVCGIKPFGYHLCSNLLHAANVALLFVLVRRLIAAEMTKRAKAVAPEVQLAAAIVALIFALHPLSAEPVSVVSYSSDLLVTFFTLLALIAATVFRPENLRTALLTGTAGMLCAFAAVTCKESGLAVAPLLIVYWFLFRRNEAKAPWFLFLSAATIVTAAFLAARFLLAPPNHLSLSYRDGSLFRVFLIQSRLWVFMMGKLLWPTQLSADYTLENISGLTTPVALVILAIVVSFQGWLAWRSRLGALGAAFYWLGLVTVSNFTPLNRILADRFYYLPMAGVAMQLLALLLMTLRSRWGFWMMMTPLLVALLPFTVLTVTREAVFANDLSLWSNTLQASPFSPTAYNNMGIAMIQIRRVPEAIGYYEQSLQLRPDLAEVHNNLGKALLLVGQTTEAIKQFEETLQLKPEFAEAHNNLGAALLQSGRISEAIGQFQQALKLKPNYVEAYNNLGVVFERSGLESEAIEQYEQALKFKPDDTGVQNNLENLEARMKAAPIKK